eukprot:GFUD01035954.1.p1 GENE.GFUD01035954.1~~GFUD01035954.1.p1  ORF type:complete len:1471 (+),score=415.21 GFUD01035954.1:79-4491(+)
MSPRYEDSPLVRPFTVRRSLLVNRQKPVATEYKIPRPGDKSVWLGKKSQIQSASSNSSQQNWERDLLNLYSASPSEGSPETLRDSTSHRPVLSQKIAATKVPRSPRLSRLSSLLSEEPHAPSDTQCDTSMRGRKTRASTDSSVGPEMPSGSGSSRLTSPMGRREKDSEMVSPKTPKSGKRKREASVLSPRSRNKAVKATLLADNDADEIIEVDDTETPPAKPLRALRSATVLTDYSKVCEFPVGSKDKVSVCLSDYKTLEHDTFLNDIIIDFYLTYLYHVFLNKEDQPTVHIFSTMFYKRLNSTPKKASTVASYEKDSSLKPAEKRHMRVKGWTKNVNLFEKNMVIIPICEHSHWYLVIAIRPGLITIPLGSDDRQTKGEPFMIVLDSMGGNKSAAVTNIRHYLAAEWKAKMCGEEGDEDEYEFSSKEMKTVRPKKPEQENYSDCGIYLLHYIEMMFKSVAQYYWPASIQDLNNWFSIEEISTKRDEIARLIRELSEDQNLDKEMTFPTDINFLPTVPVTRSHRRNRDYDEHSSESEEDDWGKGHVLGGSSGIGASGFYGERSGQTRNLRSGDSSSATGGSGESDVSSHTASEIAREARHRNREQRSSKEKPKGGSAKIFKEQSTMDSSRLDLANKIKQIQNAKSDFDEMQEYKSPKPVKTSRSSEKTEEGQTKRRTGRIPSGESVIVVDPNVTSQQKSFSTSVVPSIKRSPKKPDQSRTVPGSKSVKISGPPLFNNADPKVTGPESKQSTSSGSGRNSIVNSIQIKSRADLHKELNCVADLHKIAAEMEEFEEKVEEEPIKRKVKGAAYKAFREDQKAIHESIVNEASRTARFNAFDKSEKIPNSKFSQSLPAVSKKKVKSTPEKRKVLQNKVMEDLLELEEEGNTEDEEEEITEKVEVLEIEEKVEEIIETKKVKVPKVKEKFRGIVTEKVKIKDGKEMRMFTPDVPEKSTGFMREATPGARGKQVNSIEYIESEYIESPMNSPEITTVDDTPEITTVEDTIEIVVDDISEVTTIDDPITEEVVAIEDEDFPLVGFLEKVEVVKKVPSKPESDADSVVSVPQVVDRFRKSTSEPTETVLFRKSTSEPDSPKVKSKSTSEPDSPKVKSKSTSEPDSPKINSKSTSVQNSLKIKSKSTSESESPQFKTLKSTSEPDSPHSVVSTLHLEQPDPQHVNSSYDAVSQQTKQYASLVEEPNFPKMKFTQEPEIVETESNLPIISKTKSTSEPHSPIFTKSKSRSEPLNPNPIVFKKQKHKYVPKIQIDSDSDDGGNSSGSDCNFQPAKSLETLEDDHVTTRPRRQRQFSSLSEIERAKLKNIPTDERKRILEDYAVKQKKKKPQDRNQLSTENPFYMSPRGAKSVQQQRGSKSVARISIASDESASEGNFLTGTSSQENSVQIDYNSSNKLATTKKKFRLNANHGKLSPHPQSSKARPVDNFNKQFSEKRRLKGKAASDSGSSDLTDVYTTVDL